MKSSLLDPTTASNEELRAKVERVAQLCENQRGTFHFPGERDPLPGLIQTLLTHNTTDPNAFAAYDRMIDRFGDWEAIHKAPLDELAQTIRIAGLHNQKAKRIQDLLGFLLDKYGSYTADALREMEFDTAFATFGHLAGVKHKTLAVVLCFDLGRDVFPVDTHVHRLCTRLGFVPEKYDPVKTFQAMRELVPEGMSHQFHVHLIRHGREVCHARKPACSACILRDECRYYSLSGT